MITKARRRKLARQAVAELSAKLMAAQAGPAVPIDGIPPGLNVFPSMEAAWRDLGDKFIDSLPRKMQEDARFIFYHGVQAAANLMIYCAGQGKFEAAADQITADCIAYEKEAERVLKERKDLVLAELQQQQPN